MEDAVYEAAFERVGVIRVNDLDDVFAVAQVFIFLRLPRGSGPAIIGNACGHGVIATYALLPRGSSFGKAGRCCR